MQTKKDLADLADVHNAELAKVNEELANVSAMLKSVLALLGMITGPDFEVCSNPVFLK